MPDIDSAVSSLRTMAAVLDTDFFTAETRYADELRRVGEDKEKDEQQKRDAILLLLLLFAFLAYQEGVEDGGAEVDQDTLTIAQRTLINSFAVSQTEFAAGLAKAMAEQDKADEAVITANKKLSETVANTSQPADVKAEAIEQAKEEVKRAHEAAQSKQAIVERRITMWKNSLRTMRALGLAWAAGSMELTWFYGDTAHCRTCLWLNGQTHPLAWYLEHGYIPGQPGSPTLECGGWECKCGAYDNRGIRRL